MKRIGRLNEYWEKVIRQFLLDYKRPFNDIEKVEINTTNGEISIKEKNREIIECESCDKTDYSENFIETGIENDLIISKCPYCGYESAFHKRIK